MESRLNNVTYDECSNRKRRQTKEKLKFIFLQQNIKNNINDKINNKTFLHITALSGNVYSTRYLLAMGASSDITDDITGNSPLLDMVLNGNETLVELFLNYGANPTIKNKDGYDALSLVKNNKTKLLRLYNDSDKYERMLNLIDSFAFNKLCSMTDTTKGLAT